MKHPTFPEGAAIALVASLAGSILFTLIPAPLLNTQVLRLLISVGGLMYSVYLLASSTEHAGRVSAAASWILLGVASWLLDIPLSLYLVIHLGAIWSIRSLYFHSSLLPALADLGLIGLGLASAAWAFMHTGSLFLAIWCFFRTQALFVFIPASGRGGPGRRAVGRDDGCDRAHCNARAAWR